MTFRDNGANCTQQEINKKRMGIMDKIHFGVAGAVWKGIGSFSMHACSLPCLYMSYSLMYTFTGKGLLLFPLSNSTFLRFYTGVEIWPI